MHVHRNVVVLRRILSTAFIFSLGFISQAHAIPTSSPTPSFPTQAITVSSAKGAVRVGDLLPYALAAGAGTHVDSKSGGIGKGFKFLKNGGNYYFVPLVPGELSVPALPILDDAEVQVAVSDSFSVQVESAIPEAERQKPEPAPAIGVKDLPFPAWIQSLFGFSILAMIGVIIYFAIRWSKRRAAKLLKSVRRSKNPDQVALEALARLEKKGTFQAGKHKVLHFGISEILKAYLSDRFQIDAVESTTNEMLEAMRSKHGIRGLHSTFISQVADCFTSLDLVKFTDYVPKDSESRAQFDLAKKIIFESREVKSEVR